MDIYKCVFHKEITDDPETLFIGLNLGLSYRKRVNLAKGKEGRQFKFCNKLSVDMVKCALNQGTYSVKTKHSGEEVQK